MSIPKYRKEAFAELEKLLPGLTRSQIYECLHKLSLSNLTTLINELKRKELEK
jgi:hypothetical protein